MKRTELRRTAGLVSRTPLPRTAGLARRPRAPRPAPVPAGRRRSTGIPASQRLRLAARSGGLCELALPDVRRGVAENAHHRRPRGMGGTARADVHALSNLLHVCGSGNASGCHGYLERHRAQALAAGWLVPAGADPWTVPVLLGHRFLLLTDSGLYMEVA